MKTLINRFIYLCFISCGIIGIMLLMISIFALREWSIFGASILCFILFNYLCNIGYKKFSFHQFDNDFSQSAYLEPEAMARYLEANELLDNFINEKDIYKKQELRRFLRNLKDSEKNLAQWDQIFPLLQNKINQFEIYF